MLAQVSGIPNPIPIAKGLTDQIWQMPLNYFAVGGMVLFGICCIILFYIILKWAASQQSRVDAAQKTATAYEYLGKDLKEGQDRIEEILQKIWEHLMRSSPRRRE
jgi:predicted negative regulator of RcsB-dependent stress response